MQNNSKKTLAPLAERMRPDNWDGFIGQDSIRDIIKKNNSISMIFWGPPGSGKTTLAKIISKEYSFKYVQISAISSGVADLRTIIKNAEDNWQFYQNKTLLFIDEIHHFKKNQQDILLKSVEEGCLFLIGATTENPSFTLNNAILSRCKVFNFKALNEEELKIILDNALENDEQLKNSGIEISEKAKMLMFKYSNGDVRNLFNLLELSNDISDNNKIDIDTINKAYQKSVINFDKTGDFHYDTISAFIKSIRGSDPNAAIYYLALMLKGGEDIRFIARRLVISAAEDIGLANTHALVLANACYQSIDKIGMPEARILLSETTIYLASCPKSNSAYLAINEAEKFLDKNNAEKPPYHIRNAPTKLMKEMGIGKDYKYPHDYPEHFVQEEYMPDIYKNKQLYNPTDIGSEKRLKEHLNKLWKDRFK